jgi:hypothetical protein
MGLLTLALFAVLVLRPRVATITSITAVASSSARLVAAATGLIAVAARTAIAWTTVARPAFGSARRWPLISAGRATGGLAQ